MTAASSGFGDQIYGDRRADRRYSMALELHYRTVKGREPQDGKPAITRDISTGGVLFSSDEMLPRGCSVELSIEWPVLLHGTKRLRLKVYGRVVRSDGRGTAIRTIRHEFFTAGQPPQAAEQTLAPGAGAKYAWTGSLLQ
jgi:hypothetical protein